MKKDNYFEGYYFKHQSKDMNISFIPSIHIDDSNKFAMIQVIANNIVEEFVFKHEDFSIKNDVIKIADNTFSKYGIKVNLKNDKMSIFGNLTYKSLVKLDGNIMGCFKYAIGMECNHGIVSVYHTIEGILTINSTRYNFYNALGFIEKDWGTSFPSTYLWTQCLKEDFSIMISAAKIPYMKMKFMGTICFVYMNKKQYRLATYKGCKIIKYTSNEIELKQGKYTLTAKLLKENPQVLKGPNEGKMNRTIKESICCEVEYTFTKENKTLFSFTSNQASFEYFSE